MMPATAVAYHEPTATTSTMTLDDLRLIRKLVNKGGGVKKITKLVAELDQLADKAGGHSRLRQGVNELKLLDSIPTVP